MGEPSVLLLHEFGGAFGGAERYLELLGQGLTAAGASTAAIVFVDDADRAASLDDRLAGIAPGATTVVIGRSRPGPIRAAVRAHRPEVLHWNFVDPFAFRGATWLLAPWGRPSVITDHLPQLRHAGPRWESTRRIANRRIATMIVVGEAARAEAQRRWHRPPPLAVIPNGVPIPATAAPRSAWERGPLQVLFVGRLTEQKGAQQLVPDLAALRAAGTDARLTIVGEGPLEGEVRTAAREAGLDGHVDVRGFSPRPLEAMAAADVLVAPSAFEGLPFTPLEALSTGLPLVLSDIPPHRELAGDGVALGIQVVDAADRPAWVDAVRRVGADLAAASSDALVRARAHEVTHMIERTLEVYRRVGAGAASDLDLLGRPADGAR
jgi:glycosyltransferase involved in cell wall biosynthesis